MTHYGFFENSPLFICAFSTIDLQLIYFFTSFVSVEIKLNGFTSIFSLFCVNSIKRKSSLIVSFFRSSISMSNENEPKTFDEALKFYLEYRRRFEQLENEFDEYQQSSLNYEQELEIQLKQADSQIERLQQELFHERTHNEQYRERSDETIKRFDEQFDQLQEELKSCQNLNGKLTQYIRELEQTNDDLERSKTDECQILQKNFI